MENTKGGGGTWDLNDDIPAKITYDKIAAKPAA
jgi:hypothetical protein